VIHSACLKPTSQLNVSLAGTAMASESRNTSLIPGSARRQGFFVNGPHQRAKGSASALLHRPCRREHPSPLQSRPPLRGSLRRSSAGPGPWRQPSGEAKPSSVSWSRSRSPSSYVVSQPRSVDRHFVRLLCLRNPELDHRDRLASSSEELSDPTFRNA
jgi:hypothetical protein